MTETRFDTDFFGAVRAAIDSRLSSYLQRRRAEAHEISPESVELVDKIGSLTMRGGKRLRPVVLSAAFRAVDPGRDILDTIDAGASLELLQTYLLIHDDWMDQDDERRGGPAVHAMFRGEKNDDHLGAALAILAGDLASAYALELMLAAPFPETRRAEALERFVTIQKEVFFGQHLDLVASDDVARMHDLKTGSYTVRGPLLLGGILADASEEQLETLVRFGNPMGEAFQVRDDLLGTFGDVETTGKPSGNDLRNGKRTALVAEVERLVAETDRGALTDAFGNLEATEAQIAAATELIVSSGARANVEARLAQLIADAKAALSGGPLGGDGAKLLGQVADKLAVRSH